MARKYMFRFRNLKTYERQNETACGNTKRSAERSARAKLREKLGIESTDDWFRASVSFVGSS